MSELIVTGWQGLASQSSLTHGYTSGGGTTSSATNIRKFNFTIDGNGQSEVGTLISAVSTSTGTQH